MAAPILSIHRPLVVVVAAEHLVRIQALGVRLVEQRHLLHHLEFLGLAVEAISSSKVDLVAAVRVVQKRSHANSLPKENVDMATTAAFLTKLVAVALEAGVASEVEAVVLGRALLADRVVSGIEEDWLPVSEFVCVHHLHGKGHQQYRFRRSKA